jgi:hypothetical protein
MNGSDAALYDGSRGQVPEPVFQDVPFDESEWRALYDILRQVNQPKAELMRVQYEVVRTAYQHYMSARAEERNAYAMQRADDEAYNRAVAEQRLAVEAQIREVRERWRPVLEQRRRELEQALQEAYLRAGEAGMNLRGGAFLGIGLDDAEPSEWDTPQAAQPATPAPQPSVSATRLPETRTTTPLPARMEAPYEYRTAYPAESPDVPSEPPFSAEEAAYETRMPTAQPRTAFHWLHWLAPIAVGVLLGQLLLKAFGIELTDWQNPLVWIAPLAGALAMMVWYRALWNASRALSEMYYLFNWGAGQARRIAWMAGIATLAVVLLPTAILMSAMLLVPTVPNGAMLLPALLATLLMLPLAVLAVAGGYFHGRQEIVSNTVQARVHARGVSKRVRRAQRVNALNRAHHSLLNLLPHRRNRCRQQLPRRPAATESRPPRRLLPPPSIRRSDAAPRSPRLPTPAPPTRTTNALNKSWRKNLPPCCKSSSASNRARFIPTCLHTLKSGSAPSTSSGDWRT